ncbi:hypothetical protein JOQ06_017237 [Pogonophryne albipinna]|uniref:Uncharacterized protein n=1 Tax=Pogonophryne albipinna TaxID=1090488 RepID=A0AAD6B373_9TELE|nr:hypothetical protein JOQ06_017237 [Pogonophryne albipinna]
MMSRKYSGGLPPETEGETVQLPEVTVGLQQQALTPDQKNVLSSPGQCNEVDSVMDDTENHLATMYQCHKNRSPQPSCEKYKQGISHRMCMTPSQLGPS